MTTTATGGAVELAALWRVLSLGFAPPTEETLAEIEALASGLVTAGSALDLGEVLAAVRSARTEDVSAQFSSLFRGKVRVSPYEGSYERDPIRQGRQMADVAAFYRAFGAEAHGPAAERPDHVGCELEFLAFLEVKELDVEEDCEIELLEGIARSFLTDHAGRWLPTFFADVVQSAGHAPLYRALAVLGARVLEDELSRRGIEPSPLPGRTTRSSVEADSLACGDDTLGS